VEVGRHEELLELRGVLQYVAALWCCSVLLQCVVAVCCCSVLLQCVGRRTACAATGATRCVAVYCCSVFLHCRNVLLQWVAAVWLGCYGVQCDVAAFCCEFYNAKEFFFWWIFLCHKQMNVYDTECMQHIFTRKHIYIYVCIYIYIYIYIV